MTNEQKQLLLKDLCARLPYRVNALASEINKIGVITDVNVTYKTVNLTVDNASGEYELVPVIDIKPYLRPISSMTEEEWIKFYKWANCRIERDSGEIGSKSRGFGEGYEYIGIDDMSDAIDWLNANGFDHRGLIPMGLALEAPEDMYSV